MSQRVARRRLIEGVERLEVRQVLSAVWTGGGGDSDGETELVVARTPVFTGTPASPATPAPAPPFPLNQTFLLNSRPGASKTIYLDFDGHVTTGTAWNTTFNVAQIVTPTFDFDGNPGSFSALEQERIQRIWQRTAEDFAPFDVNVTTQFTTEDALIRTDAQDIFWGMRAAIGGTFNIIPGLGGAGGVAFLSVFGDIGSQNFSPAFVFSDTQGNDEQVVTETISHEIGHTLGLDHDGSAALPYYPGHGIGQTAWGTIMGAAFGIPLTQWNNGTYPGANNQEDDLAIITDVATNGFDYRPDDHGNTLQTATPIQLTSAGGGSFGGVIERNTDEDWFQVLLPDGATTITALPAERGPNLDIQLDLIDSGGNIIQTSNPVNRLDATIAQTLRGGIYYARVQGVGKAPVTGHPGYTKYGSLGQYTLNFSVIPSSHIQGVVYLDGDADGSRQASDPPAVGFTVFIDDNFNTVPDANESTAITDVNGFFDLLTVPGTRNVRVVTPPGYFPTDPPSGVKTVNVGANGATVGGVLLGISGAKGTVVGRKWLDNSGNASIDPSHGDGPLQGVFIYVDLDLDGRAGIGEPAAVTDANGNFVIHNVPIGPRVLREVLTPGFATAFPVANDGSHVFVMTPGAVISALDFFNSPAHDYGDAPDSYRTLLASGGPVHGYRRGFQLGGLVDADPDGQPTASAKGDDNAFADDEDGIVFSRTLSPGGQVDIEATVNVPAFVQNGYLHGWIDFNGDGDFGDANEKVIKAVRLGTGVHTFTVNVPQSIPLGVTYARFRYSVEATMGPGGRSLAGEVEDYAVQVFDNVPTTNPDTVTVQQFSVDNVVDVLANDVRSNQGRLFIASVSDDRGLAEINDNGTPNDPYDDFIEYDAAPAPQGHVGRFYSDNFTYTVSDGVTESPQTIVNVRIEKVSTAPVALDDIAHAFPNLTAGSTRTTTIAVLANDNGGTDRGSPRLPALVDFDTVARNSAGDIVGSIIRDDRGTASQVDDRLVFRPTVGVNNTTATFTYRINNPGSTDPSLQDEGTVTVQIRPAVNRPDANDQIKLSIQVLEPQPNTPGPNNPYDTAPGAAVQQQTLVRGQEYWVGVFADDLRQAFQLGAGGNGNGALAVYLDLLYDDRFVQAVRVPVSGESPLGLQVLYGPRYSSGNSQESGQFKPGGIIDELGITSDGGVGSAANQPVLYVKFRATAATPNSALVQMWKSDPADGKPNDPTFDPAIIVNDENPPNGIRNVDPENIAYLRSFAFRVVSPAAAAAMVSTSSTTTTASSFSLAAPAPTSTSTTSGGPSQQELLAFYSNIGSSNLGSQISSTAKSSSTPKATDDAILSLLDELLASKKTR